jgi:hypothetical protein
MHRTLLCSLLLLTAFAPAHAAVPTEPAERATLVGTPAQLLVEPASVSLVGPHSHRQLVVTGKYADGSMRDLTALCEFSSEQAAVASVDATGYVSAKQNGATQLLIKAGTLTTKIAVTVKDTDKAVPTSFRNDVIAAFNVGGCNSGACHGTPSGKGGFKLSLRGFDPEADFQQLTRDVLGRRTSRLDANTSLILLKGLGRVPHEGGQRFQPNSVSANTVHRWLSEGLQDDPAKLPSVTKVEVVPGSRVQNAPGRFQQLAVLATFSDGSTRDVTRLSVFTSSDTNVADVGVNGLVEFKGTGETAIQARYLLELVTIRLTYLEPRKDFVWNNPKENNYIDKHVFAKLKMLSIVPSGLCTDDEFLRRAYLDVIGIMPTAEEVKKFLADKSPDKRAKLVDELLERPEFADFWTMKWSDVFRSSRKTIQVKGTHLFQNWLRTRIKEDVGFDRVVRDLLVAKGSSTANPAASYYRIARDAQNLAETTAQLFFGIRMQCAKCHNHPFERWTQDDYYSTAAWFARVRQKNDPRDPSNIPGQPGVEIVYTDRSGEVTQPRTGKVIAPKFLGAEIPVIPAGKDRREIMADWVTGTKNPFFAKNVVNRVWYHLLGRGIVDPVDDFRDSNPSANDELLEALAKNFAENKFRFKPLIRDIVNSRTYQLSAKTTSTNKDDNKYFSRTMTKLLPAEVLLDAICQTTEMPEKYAGMPAGTRAVQLPDGDANHPFLKTFGQPARELACECERESDSNLAQALQLINGPTVNDKLRAPNNRVGRLLTKKTTDREMLDELYMSTLSRTPTEEDVKSALEYLTKASDKRKAWEDIHWALLNTKEFLFRH